MMKGCLQCGAIFVAIVAIIAGIDPAFRTLLHIYPLYWSMWSASWFLEYDGSDLLPESEWDAALDRLTPVQEVGSISEMAKNWDLPYIVRGIVPDCHQQLKDTPTDDTATFFDYNIMDHGTVSRVGINYTGSTEELPIQPIINGEAELTGKYCSFRTFLSDEQIEAVMPQEMKDVGAKVRRDTNFVSNFSEPVVTAVAHAAILSKSWSLQCLGEKRWLLVDAASNDALRAIPMPSLIPGKFSERYFFTDPDIKLHTVVMRPGDLMYFPPSWMHVVETRPGPNIMLNLRQMAMYDSFRLNFWHSTFAMIIRVTDLVRTSLHNSADHYTPTSKRNKLEEHVVAHWKSQFWEREESEFLKRVFDKMK